MVARVEIEKQACRFIHAAIIRNFGWYRMHKNPSDARDSANSINIDTPGSWYIANSHNNLDITCIVTHLASLMSEPSAWQNTV